MSPGRDPLGGSIVRRPRRIIAGKWRRRSSMRAELAGVLADDDSLLGEVYRRIEAVRHRIIRAARGADRPNFVWNYLRTIRALLDNELPTAPSVARATARSFRSI